LAEHVIYTLGLKIVTKLTQIQAMEINYWNSHNQISWINHW